MSETYTPPRPPVPPGVAPSQPASSTPYYQAPPLREYQPESKPHTNTAMLIWGCVLGFIGVVATALYIWILVVALVNGAPIRKPMFFAIQVIIALAPLVVGIVLVVRARRKTPRHY